MPAVYSEGKGVLKGLDFVKGTRIRVGFGACGIAAGAEEVYRAAQDVLELHESGIPLEKTGCIGMCFQEPLVEIESECGRSVLLGRQTPELITSCLRSFLSGGELNPEFVVAGSDYEAEDDGFFSKQHRIVLSNCGRINPEEIEEYLKVGGYRALEKAIREMKPEDIIEEVFRSGLRGRGGAGFPTGLKWKLARAAQEPQPTGSKSSLKEPLQAPLRAPLRGQKKYIVCNADEGDPGAFMDRSVLESDPHSVIEGMIIGAYAIGADEGYIYVRAEYPLAVHRLHIALSQVRERGFIGKNILGSSFSFNIHIKEGAGAFVCGEETALMASIEGRRGMPRLRPPFPTERGIWGKPTNINNVETYANIPRIVLNGAGWYSSLGTEKSKGTKVFALAGKIKRGGLIEVPMGVTLREIIYDIGGGIKSGRAFKAVQMGGPSGGCIPDELIDTVIDYDSVTKTGAIMGSGGMVVMDEDTCMVEIARYFLEFTQKESCGKCTFCRIGTKRMLEILEKITSGRGEAEDIEKLENLAVNVKMGSLCGLGQTAPNPVLTTLRYFRHEYEAHIKEKRCPARQCRGLIKFSIVDENCTGCGLCKKSCPVEAVSGERKKPHLIDQSKCIKCGLCFDSCKFEAILVE